MNNKKGAQRQKEHRSLASASTVNSHLALSMKCVGVNLASALLLALARMDG